MKNKTNKTSINIDHIAKLASLPLTNEEKDKFGEQLTKILDYVELIESVKTEDIEPTFNVSLNKNITRKDKVETSLTQEEVLKNAKRVKDGFIVTKGVFEEA